MDESEEKKIEEKLFEHKFVTHSRVATVVQQFVKERRRKWKKNREWRALRTERKFGGDDCPSMQWCAKFLSRHPKLTIKKTGLVRNAAF